MTRKEQIAKKAAQAAALATYKAILNPPVWKVAGTSFKTSPTWEDIAKAAAAACYSSVLKMAEDVVIKEPLVVKKDTAKADDTNSAVTQMPADVKPDMLSLSRALNRESPAFAAYIRAGAQTNQVPTDAKNFIDYVNSGVPKEAGETWVKPGNLINVLDLLLSNVDAEKKVGLKQYLLSLSKS